MKKITIIKKKEVIIGLMAVLFLIIGLLSYNPIGKNINSNSQKEDENSLGEAILISSNAVDEEESNVTEETLEDSEETENDTNNYFIKAKMDRDNIYSQTLEIYANMLENSEIPGDQKIIAQNEITNISNERKTIAVAENLIILKGFENVVIFKNEDDVSVIVKSDVLLPENVSQIQNIVQREFNIDSKNISITNK